MQRHEQKKAKLLTRATPLPHPSETASWSLLIRKHCTLCLSLTSKEQTECSWPSPCWSQTLVSCILLHMQLQAERNSYWEPTAASASEAHWSLVRCHPQLASCLHPPCICASKGADVSAWLSTRLFLWGNRLCFVLAQLARRQAHFPAPML